MIPSLCWIARGLAAEEPAVLKLDSEELNHLIEKTKQNLEIVDGPDGVDSDEEVESSVDNAAEQMCNKINEDDEFNMAGYDEEEEMDGQRIFGAGLSGVTYYANPEDDPYITFPQAAKDEEEGYGIKPTDNLICCAKLDGEMSNIEVHLWNEKEQDFYVHHDILLDKFPLCVEWLSFDAGDQEEIEGDRAPGNYIALGCMSPLIEIWDIDIVDTSEPVAVLGQRLKHSKKKPKVGKKGHSDAVMSLSWNKLTQNIIASGSADCSILLWDLETGSAKECLTHHKDKVQTLCWHLAEGTTLLSGGYDNTCQVTDCRTKNSKSWTVDGEVEHLMWDVSNPFSFLAGTSNGSALCIDIRQEKPLYTIAAHDNEVSGLAMTKQIPGLLATCSADRTVKVWQISDNRPSCVTSRAFPEAGSLHCLSFCPDYATMLAIGALEGGLLMWDIASNKEFREAFNHPAVDGS
ncbi:periodic tryptophan protein 1 homolog [Bolinopsis microptera]|uniref:periodic tryptophan protein 1 homolog n=1 Tax=Bolinopsis microptera TaxID=2820187 RepID=UPI00307B04C9